MAKSLRNKQECLQMKYPFFTTMGCSGHNVKKILCLFVCVYDFLVTSVHLNITKLSSSRLVKPN